MKNTKIIICLILSITIGIAAATPLINAELNIRPWITRVQGPTAPFNSEVVYANFTITNSDAPITQTSGPTIDYYVAINVTNPSEYRARLRSTLFVTAQEIYETTEQSMMAKMNIPGASGRGIEAKGAWVDGIYYNVTCTIPSPLIDENGTVIGYWYDRFKDGTIEDGNWQFMDEFGNTRTEENSTREDFYNHAKNHQPEWIEGIQGYEYTIRDGINTNKYIFLNIDGEWVDVTGRVTFDKEPEPDKTIYPSKGIVSSQWLSYLSAGTKASKENEFDCSFAPGESRLLVFYGSVDIRTFHSGGSRDRNMTLQVSEGLTNPVDIIQSGIIQSLTQIYTDIDIEFDSEAYFENNTITVTRTDAANIQELVLTQIGNSYIYNTVLSDNQIFELDQHGFEAFIVSVR
jgi:hypothetical protein